MKFRLSVQIDADSTRVCIFCTQIGVILKVDCSFVLLSTWSVLPIKLENNKSAGLWMVKACSCWFSFRCYMGHLMVTFDTYWGMNLEILVILPMWAGNFKEWCNETPFIGPFLFTADIIVVFVANGRWNPTNWILIIFWQTPTCQCCQDFKCMFKDEVIY